MGASMINVRRLFKPGDYSRRGEADIHRSTFLRYDVLGRSWYG